MSFPDNMPYFHGHLAHNRIALRDNDMLHFHGFDYNHCVAGSNLLTDLSFDGNDSPLNGRTNRLQALWRGHTLGRVYRCLRCRSLMGKQGQRIIGIYPRTGKTVAEFVSRRRRHKKIWPLPLGG